MSDPQRVPETQLALRVPDTASLPAVIRVGRAASGGVQFGAAAFEAPPFGVRPSGGVRVPFQLPPAAEEFVGRRRELGLLTERLRGGKKTAVVGPAGMGKTAMAAKGLREVFGERGERLAGSHFPDGIVYLDLYALRGQREAAWEALATAVRGVDFLQQATALDRVKAACDGRRILLVIEGGEEADGAGGRLRIGELWSVLGGESGWLLLTRLKNQVQSIEMVEIEEFLDTEDAGRLLDIFTRGKVEAGVRERMLALLAGHPLALTWAGNLLGREEEDAEVLVRAWETGRLPRLNDPTRAEHTLEWLFGRSVAGLDSLAERALLAAGLLAHASFPAEAVLSVLRDGTVEEDERGRGALRTLVQRSLLRRGKGDSLQFTHVLGYQFARKERGVEGEALAKLGAWLHSYFGETLSVGGRGGGSMVQPLEHLDALLRADERRELWRPLVGDALYDFRERLIELGRLGQAKQLIATVTRWMQTFSAEEKEEAAWRRERSWVANFVGDVLMEQGDIPGALTSYRASLEIARRLAEADPTNAGWQRDLSVSHNKVGDVLMAQGDVPGALTSYRASLEIARRLAEADPTNAGWQRDLSVSHNKVGDVLMAQGDVPGALDAYRAALEIARRLAEADPTNAGWQRDLIVSHIKVGDVLMAQGDVPGALTSYRASLEIARRLAEADHTNAGWQRDLSVSHDNVGDVLMAQGDVPGALTSYRASLEIARRLAEADPTNAGWQRDLSVSHEKVGDVLMAQGDVPGALDAYRASLEIARRLAEADPTNAGWQRDLSVSHEKVGNVLMVQGDVPGALDAYRASLEIRRRLAEADPTNAGWQRDLSVSHSKVGDVLMAQGDFPGALTSYRASLEIRRRLAEADPTNAGWQRDLIVSHIKVGDGLMAQGDVPGALTSYRASLEIARRLAEADPTNAGWQRDLIVSHSKVGDVLVAQGDVPGALTSYRAALEIARRLAEADPTNAGWQRDLSVSLTNIALAYEREGDLTEALSFAEESLRIDERLSALDPSNAAWRNDVADSRRLVERLRGGGSGESE